MRGAVLGFKFVAEIGSIVAQLLMSSVSKLRNFQLTIMRLKMSRAMNPARHIEQLEKAQFVRRNRFLVLTSFQQVGLASVGIEKLTACCAARNQLPDRSNSHLTVIVTVA